MWYLDGKTLGIIAAFTILLILLRIIFKDGFVTIRRYAFLVFGMGLLTFYSKRLAAFYILLILANYILFQLILKSGKLRKIFFGLAILGNLILVSTFRFAAGELVHIPLFNIVLLIGLSYTFLRVINLMYYAYFFEENISILDLTNYVLFIPTFTAGPIMLYQDFKNEMESIDSSHSIEASTKRIIMGFFKKVVLAQLLFSLYQYIMSGQLNFYTSVAVLFLYYILGYFDFSGYSDIAVGFGGLMGITVPENFKNPFASPSLTQFWRNWHITLGHWARTHIFMPLSGRTMSPLKSGALSLLIFAFIGLWHGYNLSFFLWGIYQGIIIFFENIFKITTVNKKKVHPAYFWFRCFLTNTMVAFGEIFLISENTDSLKKILEGFTRF